MPKLRKIILGHTSPVAGSLLLTPSVTFIAGPNGTGKTRLLRWLRGHTADWHDLLVGSSIVVLPGELDDIVKAAYPHLRLEEPVELTMVEGTIGVAAARDGEPALHFPDVLGDDVANAPDELKQLVGFDRGVSRIPTTVFRNTALNLDIPVQRLPQPRSKLLGSKRLQSIQDAMSRRTNLRNEIAEAMSEENLRELFALLEMEAALEVEALARVEALTSVRPQLAKDGASYRLTFTRVGTDHQWSIDQEADGVIAIFAILPYLYSTQHDLLFVDEPEAHLYPGLQQTLRTLVYDAAERTGKQIVLATHSERVVAPPLANFRDSIHVSIPAPIGGEVITLRDALMRAGDSGALSQWLLSQAFGDNQDSMFSALFASEVVVVEGPTDMIFLDRLARYVGREFRAGSVALVDAGGKGGVSMVVALLKALGRLVKVVVDADVMDDENMGVLRAIARSMGADEEHVAAAAAGGIAELQRVAREYDVHILSHRGVEGFYRHMIQTGDKRTRLIREITLLQDRSPTDVRQMYPELITILEAAVRRMPSDWLEAHLREVTGEIAEAIRQWRRTDITTISHADLATKLIALLPSFHSHDLLPSKNEISLHHKFLERHALSIRRESDAVTVLEHWSNNFM